MGRMDLGRIGFRRRLAAFARRHVPAAGKSRLHRLRRAVGKCRRGLQRGGELADALEDIGIVGRPLDAGCDPRPRRRADIVERRLRARLRRCRDRN